MIRVLFIDHLADLGGAEINLLNILKHLDKKHFEPVVACPTHGLLWERIRHAGIVVEPLVINSHWGATNMIRSTSSFHALRYIILGIKDLYTSVVHLLKIIHSIKPDVLYLNTLKAGIFGGLAGRFARLPVVQHIQDMVSRTEFNALFAHLTAWSLNRFPDRIIAISDAVKFSLLDLGVDPEKISRIYNGVELERFRLHENGVNLKRKLGLEENIPLVGIVARLMRWKGQEVFLKAAATVRAHTRFMVVGGLFWESPAFEHELRTLARELGIADRVTFAGQCENMPEIMNALDLFVHASTRPEPFGLGIIEAMAAAKPVIATRGGAIPEIVVSGKTGLVVSPGDPLELSEAMEFLLARPELMAAMGNAGQKRAKEYFLIERTVEQIEKTMMAML